MENITDFLQQHWLELCLFVAGCVVSFYLGRRYYREKSPRYAISSVNYFQDIVSQVPQIEMRFEGYGQPLHTLSISKIVLWNAGKETINKADIVDADPLCIKVKDGCSILEASVVQEVKQDVNGFAVQNNRDRNKVTISFKFLDQGQGAVVQIIHTGKTRDDIELSGTIKGARLEEVKSHVPRWVGFLGGSLGLLLVWIAEAYNPHPLLAILWMFLFSWVAKDLYLRYKNVPRAFTSLPRWSSGIP